MSNFGRPGPVGFGQMANHVASQMSQQPTLLTRQNTGIPPAGPSSLFQNSNPVSNFTSSQNSFQTGMQPKFHQTTLSQTPSFGGQSGFQQQRLAQAGFIQPQQGRFTGLNPTQGPSNFINTGTSQTSSLFPNNMQTQGFQQQTGFQQTRFAPQGNFQMGGAQTANRGFMQTGQPGTMGTLSTRFQPTAFRDLDQNIRLNSITAMDQFNKFQIEQVRFQDYSHNKTGIPNTPQFGPGQTPGFPQQTGITQNPIGPQSNMFPQNQQISPFPGLSQNPALARPGIGNTIGGNLQQSRTGLPGSSLFPSQTQPGAPGSLFPTAGGLGQPQTGSSLFPSTGGLGQPQTGSTLLPSAGGLGQPQTGSSLFPQTGQTGNSLFPTTGRIGQPPTGNSLFPTGGQSSLFPSTGSLTQPGSTPSLIPNTGGQLQGSSLFPNTGQQQAGSLFPQSNPQIGLTGQASLFPSSSSLLPSGAPQSALFPSSTSSFSPNRPQLSSAMPSQVLDGSMAQMTTAYKDPFALTSLFPNEKPQTVLDRYNNPRTPQYQRYTELQRIIKNRQTPLSTKTTEQKWRETLDRKFFSSKPELKPPMMTTSKSFSSFNFKTKVPQISYKSAISAPIQSDYFNLVINCFDPDLTRIILGVSVHTKIKELRHNVMTSMQNSDPKTIQLTSKGRVLTDKETIGSAQITSNDQVNVVKIDFQQLQNTVEVVPDDLLPKLERTDYFTTPSMVQLSRMSRYDLEQISDFTIGNKFGKIVFEQPINLVNLDLDSIVIIEDKSIILYPDQSSSTKHPIGEGLNKPAFVHLYNCFPSRKLPNEQFEAKIKRLCEKEGTQFIKWNSTTGEWVFRAKHF